MRRLLAGLLMVALAGCAGTESGPAHARGGRPTREHRPPTPAVARPPDDASAAWATVQARVRRGEAAAVLVESQRAAAAAEAAGDAIAATAAHTGAAYAAQRLGRFDVSVREGRAAVASAAKTGDWPWRDTHIARARRFTGMALRQLGRPADAERELEAALAAARVANAGRPNLALMSNVNSALAFLASARGERDAAIRYAEEAVRMTESTLQQLGPRTRPQRRVAALRQLASSQIDLAGTYLGAGRVDDAERQAGGALGNARSAGAPDLEVNARAVLAHVAGRRKDPRAVPLFEEAIVAARKNAQVTLLAGLYTGLANLHAAAGRGVQALDSARQALALIEGIRGRLEDADLRSSFFEGKQGLYQNAIRLALSTNQPAEGFALAERSRARAFLDLLGTHTALSKGRTEALAAEELRLRARLAAARAGASPDEEDEESESGPAGSVEAVEREYAEFLKTVRAMSGEQASLMSVEPVTLAEVQALLDEGTTLLEYLVTPREVVVWVVDRTRAEVVRVPAGRATLVADVRDFRRAIADLAPAAEIEKRATALHRQLVTPLRALVRGDRVVVVPHDVLHYLPFAALRSPEGRWLVEDWRLSTVPSASVLKYLRGKGSAATGPAVALGNPELGPELALRFAEREARAVADALPGTRVYVRGQATEREAKALAPTASVLHFATHAVLDENDPLASALLLVAGDGEDGRLEVRELFRLDLRARLVVLSACETGLGRLSQGDELVGLQRAFLYAGTPAVVTTLWKVDDRASFVLMRRFYDALAANGPGEALRRAQRASLAEEPHPFFWAAFGLAGDPR